MGAFSVKFSTPPSGKTMDRTQKRFRPKIMARLTSTPCKIWWKSRDARRRERMECDVFHFFYFYFYYRQDLPQAALPVLLLLTGQFLGFGPLLHAKFRLDRSRGGGLRPLKLKKNWNFTNIIAPKGRLPYTIFTKFTSFMRVHRLNNSAKFGCFISINEKNY